MSGLSMALLTMEPASAHAHTGVGELTFAVLLVVVLLVLVAAVLLPLFLLFLFLP